mmetsp:Transcript_10243/g.35653  ORF Transcript_10243/g.35653 Transcript_10243/m.35653 type:complete len:228 (+) Transcript_10243:791-1474(+)
MEPCRASASALVVVSMNLSSLTSILSSSCVIDLTSSSRLAVESLKNPWYGSSRSLRMKVRNAMENAVTRHISSSILADSARMRSTAKKVTNPNTSRRAHCRGEMRWDATAARSLTVSDIWLTKSTILGSRAMSMSSPTPSDASSRTFGTISHSVLMLFTERVCACVESCLSCAESSTACSRMILIIITPCSALAPWMFSAVYMIWCRRSTSRHRSFRRSRCRSSAAW